MNFFAVTGYVVFCMSVVNVWLEKFVLYNLANTGYLWRKFFSVTNTAQYDTHQAYKTYANGVIGVLGVFGLNAILHSFELNILPLTLVMYGLNLICFAVHCLYTIFLPFHINQDYEGLALGYNFVMWLYLNYVYFLTSGNSMYFTYFVILTIPQLFRAYFGLYNYHYYGDNVLIKTLDVYLNYF